MRTQQWLACVSNRSRRAHGPGWALVGDAGYHRDPVTGHGLSDAYPDAELLAVAPHRTLRGDTDDGTAAQNRGRSSSMPEPAAPSTRSLPARCRSPSRSTATDRIVRGRGRPRQAVGHGPQLRLPAHRRSPAATGHLSKGDSHVRHPPPHRPCRRHRGVRPRGRRPRPPDPGTAARLPIQQPTLRPTAGPAGRALARGRARLPRVRPIRPATVKPNLRSPRRDHRRCHRHPRHRPVRHVPVRLRRPGRVPHRARPRPTRRRRDNPERQRLHRRVRPRTHTGGAVVGRPASRPTGDRRATQRRGHPGAVARRRPRPRAHRPQPVPRRSGRARPAVPST